MRRGCRSSSSRRGRGSARRCRTSTRSRAVGGTCGRSGRAGPAHLPEGGLVTGYLLRRALHALLVLLIVTLAAFLLIHMVPGDPVRITLGAHAPPEAVQRVRHQLGLDRSLVEQFGSFLAGLPRGDLGTSINLQQPVRDIIGPRIWPSVFLLAYGTLISLFVA